MTATDLILQWSLAGIVGLVLLLRRQLTLFHPSFIYLAFHVLFFCIHPALLHAFDLEAMWGRMGFHPEPEHLRLALMASSAALVTFVVACSLAAGRSTLPEFSKVREFDGSDVRSLLITAAVFVPIGMYAIVRETGAIGSGVLGDTAQTVGYASDLRPVLVPVSLLVLLVARWRWWSFAPFAAWLAFASGTSGDIAAIVTGVFLLLLVWLWSQGRKAAPFPGTMAAFLLVACALLIAQNGANLRGWFVAGETHALNTDEGYTLTDRIDRPGFAAFNCLAYIVAAVPEKSGTYTLGSQHWGGLTELNLGRGENRNGAPASSRTIHLSAYGRFEGLPISLVGDGWMSGGWLGLILTMGFTGGALGLAFRKFVQHLTAPAPAGIYLALHAAAPLFYRDSALSVLILVGCTVAPMVFWSLLATRIRSARATADEREALRGRREQRRILGHAILSPDPGPIPPMPAALSEGPETDDPDEPGKADEAAEPPVLNPGATGVPQPRWRDNGGR